MALSARERPGSIAVRGLDQFHLRGDTHGVGYCIAEPKPYALEFSNTSDVICLLLGDINSSAKFEDDREKRLVFQSESTAFHPRIGYVRVRAAEVRHGFIAFSYTDDFQSLLDDRNIETLRRAGSSNNIRNDAIKFLARYVKDRLRRSGRLHPLELQFLALGTYVETMRQLDTAAPARRDVLSDGHSRSFASTSRKTSRTNSPAPTCPAPSIFRFAPSMTASRPAPAVLLTA